MEVDLSRIQGAKEPLPAAAPQHVVESPQDGSDMLHRLGGELAGRQRLSQEKRREMRSSRSRQIGKAVDETTDELVGCVGAIPKLFGEPVKLTEAGLDGGAIETTLPSEIVVDERLVDPGAAGERSHPDPIIAVQGEELGGGAQQGLSSGLGIPASPPEWLPLRHAS